jgi:hypothetical protein
MSLINEYIGLNVQFILLFIIADVLLFTRRDNPGIGWRMLFSHWIGTNGRKLYYIYRPLQFVMALAGLYFTYKLSGVYPSIAYLLAFVMYVTDLWYYVFNLELNELFAFERVDMETYWLNHFYQVFGLVFRKGFKLWLFLLASITGTVLLIISNLI